jgi:hypothetical protein
MQATLDSAPDPRRSPLAPLVGNAALSGECRVPALREWRTRHSKRTPLRGPLSAALGLKGTLHA